MNTIKKAICFLAAVALLLSNSVSFGSIFSKKSEMTITVDTKKEEQIFDGWGTSACWWSQEISDPSTRTDLAKKLFSKDGLALNIYRYNIGGGVNPEHNRVTVPWRNTESFYYFNEESGKFEYDFNRDKNAQDFLFEALSYGCIDTVVLFANSPHYSMTVSQEASGNSKKGVTNLSENKYQDFVDYFLTITEYFISKGVPVKYISPINEPQWDWGGDSVTQEGCHYEKDQIRTLMKLFSKGIDARKLDVKLSCPESGSIGDTTVKYFTELNNDPEIAKNIGTYAYHSYWSDTNVMSKIKFGKWIDYTKPFNNSKIEMSEWCELPCRHDVTNFGGATTMARIIANDVNFTGVNSWTSWVAANTIGIGEDGLKYSDGLFYADDYFSEYHTAERYYALAHFSKFIPAGSVMLKSNNSNNSVFNRTRVVTNDGIEWYFKRNNVAFKTPEGEIVIVIVNEDSEATAKLNIKNCNAKSMEVFLSDKKNKLEKTYSGKYSNQIKIPKNSITTIVIK